MIMRQLVVLLSLITVAASVYSVAENSPSGEKFAERIRSVFTTQMLKGLNAPSFVPASRMQELATTSYSSTGFLYMLYSFGSADAADTTCSVTNLVSGYPVNYCHVAESYSLKIQFTQDSCSGAIIQYFGDTECKNFLGTSSISEYADCTPYNAFGGSYLALQCSTHASPGLAGSWASQESYDGGSCQGTPTVYVGWLPTCSYFEGFYLSFDCSTAGKVTENLYNSDTCTGDVGFTAALPTTCGVDTDDDDDDGDDDDDSDNTPPFINPPPSVSTTPYPTSATQPTTSSIWYCPAQAPTAQPMGTPTAFPTNAEPVLVTFSVVQNLNGIDVATFKAAPENQATLLVAIAQSMTGITVANIVNFAVTGSSRRRLSASAVDTSVRMTYTVSTTTTASANQLFSELSSVVASGAFNTFMHDTAVALSAPDVESCTSDSVSYPSSSSKNKKLSIGAIVGIVIGSVVFVAMVVALVVYCVGSKEPALASQFAAHELAQKTQASRQ